MPAACEPPPAPLPDSLRHDKAAGGRWDVVVQLAKELEARRLAAAGVMHPVGGPPPLG